MRIDGSGRLTNRNRRFLCLYQPAKFSIEDRKQVLPPSHILSKQHVVTPPPVHCESTTGAPGTENNDFIPIDDNVVCSRNVIPDVAESGANVQPTQLTDQPTTSVVVQPPSNPVVTPHVLKRLQDFNAPGLKESTSPLRTRLRLRHKPSNG